MSSVLGALVDHEDGQRGRSCVGFAPGLRTRPQQFRTSGGKLHITLRDALPAGAAMTVVVRYGGNPRPVRSLWGDVGEQMRRLLSAVSLADVRDMAQGQRAWPSGTVVG